MKASPRQQLLLLDLQELDTLAARLRRRRESLPERAEHSELDEHHARARDTFMAVQREHDTHQAELARIESDVQLVLDRQTRDRELLTTNVSSKEAQALQQELETLAERQTLLEDRQLEMMEQLEETAQKLALARTALDEVEGQRAGLQGRISQAEGEIDEALTRNASDRELLAAEVQRDVLELYESTRARTGIGAARLRGNVSEGSNMTIDQGELQTIRAAAPDEIVFCPDSGAILVRAETDGAEA